MTRAPLPLELNPSLPSVEIDATLVARGFDLEEAEFRRLMDARKISVLCERGTGEDAGRYRASFYFEGRRVRLVVDANGQVIDAPGDAT